MKDVENLFISRCIKPSQTGNIEHQIHNFSDASEAGYGCVSYLRSCAEDEIHVSILCSKSRISPLKKLTVPRLELCAAALAVKVDATLRKELDIDLKPSVFWCDSQIVLAYISNKSKRYQTFVANRVSYIVSHSDTSQWRNIPGTTNPADVSSRGSCPSKLMEINWFTGPQFLSHTSDKWPQQIFPKISDSELEIKRSHQCRSIKAVCMMTREEIPNYMDQLIASKSNLHRLKRIVGWLILIKQRLLKRGKETNLSCSILHQAKRILVKHEKSKIDLKDYGPLSPFEDKDGLIRVGGRLRNLTQGSKILNHPNPVLIPKGLLCTLIVRDKHEKLSHMGLEYVLGEIRVDDKWIARKEVKSVLNGCDL